MNTEERIKLLETKVEDLQNVIAVFLTNVSKCFEGIDYDLGKLQENINESRKQN